MKTIAIASGKSGVGKTNVTANLAIAMRRLGNKVMIVDADFGNPNIDVLLHLAPRYNIHHMLNDGMSLKDVVVEDPHGVRIIPGGFGMRELATLSEFQRLNILDAVNACTCKNDIDVLIIDAGGGISEDVAFFCIASQEIVIVISPEAATITDAYSLIKVLHTRYQEKCFHVLVNFTKDAKDAFKVFKWLSLMVDKFMDVSLDYVGFLPFDRAVPEAVRVQKAFIDLYPNRNISKKIAEIAGTLLATSGKTKGTLQFCAGQYQ